MHPYISQVLITQRVEDAISKAAAERRYTQARRNHRRRLPHWLSRTA